MEDAKSSDAAATASTASTASISNEKVESTATIPPTDMLYMTTYEGNFCYECCAKVLSITATNQSTAAVAAAAVVVVVLDQTVLHAQGGGQPTDFGTLRAVEREESKDEEQSSSYHVSKVLLDRATGVVQHTVSDAATTLVVGDMVRVSVDEPRRKLLSECHSAGHVVDAAMVTVGLQDFKPYKAYHFLEGPYVEYAVPESYNTDMFTNSKLAKEKDAILTQLQESFQTLLTQSIETEIEVCNVLDADAKCNRIASNFENISSYADTITNMVRVVTVAGYACPCGGTHVQSTSDLTLHKWCITKFKYKSKTKSLQVKYGYSK